MSQQKFKSIVKEKLQFKVMAYLISMQNKHTKSERLSYDGNMKEYLKDENLSVSEKKFLFKLRSKMLRIKSNFSSAFKNNLSCLLCLDKESIEDENHLVNCLFIARKLNLNQEVKYEDAFLDISRQHEAVKVFKKIMEIHQKQRKDKDNQNLPGASL